MSVTADPQAHTQMAPADEPHTPAPDEPHTPAPGETLAAAPPRGFLATGWAKFSDNAIPSLVVAVIAGLVLYSFNETSDRITRLEDSVNDRFTAVDARFTKLEDNIKADFTAIDARFTKLEDNIDARFTKLEDNIKADFTAIDARFTKLEDNIKADFTAVDARFTAVDGFDVVFQTRRGPVRRSLKLSLTRCSSRVILFRLVSLKLYSHQLQVLTAAILTEVR